MHFRLKDIYCSGICDAVNNSASGAPSAIVKQSVKEIEKSRLISVENLFSD